MRCVTARAGSSIGVPALNGFPINVPRNVNYGLADDYTEQDVIQLNATVEHKVGSAMKLRNQTEQWKLKANYLLGDHTLSVGLERETLDALHVSDLPDVLAAVPGAVQRVAGAEPRATRRGACPRPTQPDRFRRLVAPLFRQASRSPGHAVARTRGQIARARDGQPWQGTRHHPHRLCQPR